MASDWFGSEICGLSVENERKGEEEMYTYNLTQWLAFFIIYCFIMLLEYKIYKRRTLKSRRSYKKL